jgi:hypothetical protein
VAAGKSPSDFDQARSLETVRADPRYADIVEKASTAKKK